MTQTPSDARSEQRRHGADDSAEADAGARLDALLGRLVEAGGSDLHLSSGAPPYARVDGRLTPIPGAEPISGADVAAMARSILTEAQWENFRADRECDVAYSVDGLARFRANLFRQQRRYGAVLRAIPQDIPPFEQLELPEYITEFARLKRGLVLVTGPTGSGKTTTLASLLDLANRTRHEHIVTIEDPIEFVHRNRRCLVDQREVGVDTVGFAEALKRVLRQDPDIIMVGEMRDLETVSAAITAAETGHLVFATIHTQSAAQTVDRVIDIFPPHQQHQIRVQLSTALQAIITQALVPRNDRPGRVPVCEVLVATAAVRNLIREGKNFQIPSVMQSSVGNGMLPFDMHLAQRLREGAMSYDQARELAHFPDEFNRIVGR